MALFVLNQPEYCFATSFTGQSLFKDPIHKVYHSLGIVRSVVWGKNQIGISPPRKQGGPQKSQPHL